MVYCKDVDSPGFIHPLDSAVMSLCMGGEEGGSFISILTSTGHVNEIWVFPDVYRVWGWIALINE